MIQATKKIKGEEIERIKFNEVRMGNWVLGYITQEPVRIDWLAIKHLSDGNVQAAFYDHSPVYVGIPLTPEILEKCGFNKTEANHTHVKKLNTFSLLNLYVTFSEEQIIITIGDKYYGKEHLTILSPTVCKYLHQLQNLYFALTGQELSINSLNQ